MIKDLVSKLPEIYQTIYNHPEYKTSRNCDHRLNYITDIIKAYQAKIGKTNLKVLDIGCAQGYYSLHLAAMGCRVTGVDFNRANINLCKGLADETGLSVKFICDEVGTAFIYEKYDIILGLSVFHHVALKSFNHAKSVFKIACSIAEIVISEMAVKQEGLYWAENLPEDYADWFKEQKFYKEIAFTNTHLGSVKRPFVVSSNKWFICQNRLYEIDEAFNKSYAGGIELPYKNLYYCGDYLCKVAHKSKLNIGHSEYMYNEVVNEAKILSGGDISFLPKLDCSEITDNYAMTVQKIDRGILLCDLLKQRIKVGDIVLYDVLDNLIELESKGLYHSDIRAWNIVIKDKAFLIDAGAIRHENKDCNGENTYMSFYRLLDYFLSQFALTDYITKYTASKDKTFKAIKRILKECLK